MMAFIHVKAFICNLTDKANKNPSINLQATNSFSQRSLCKVHVVAFIALFPLEANRIIFFYIHNYKQTELFLKIPSEMFNVSSELISYYLLCWEMPGAEQIAILGQVRMGRPSSPGTREMGQRRMLAE